MNTTPRMYWDEYVHRNGGPAGVSAKLSVPYSTIAGICNGSRGIGRSLAKRMAERDPELDESILIWVESIKAIA
jgi:plasmid maintenance system antidote protein VapI